MRVLVVEDSVRLRENVVLGLQKAGYAVDSASDGRQGLWLAQSHSYDAIVLDIMLPELDGIELLKALRKDGRDEHVLLLTARDALEDKIEGFRSGADDYLVKPFAFDELLARVGALVRRSGGRKATQATIGDCTADLAARCLMRDGKRIDLSPREFAVLEFLLSRRGQVVSRTDIESHIYDGSTDIMSNVVDAVIYSLRKKLGTTGEDSLIKTRRGAGYELVEQDE
jgi:DNA-binding response OmpR family regulator